MVPLVMLLASFAWQPESAKADASDPKQLMRQFLAEGLPRHPPLAGVPALDADNAALRYLWLADRADNRLFEASSQLDTTKAGFQIAENDRGITTDTADKMLVSAVDWIGALCRATQLPVCRFGWSEDPRAVLEAGDPRDKRLAALRRFMMVLDADGRRLAAAGRTLEASERLMSAIRLARHLVEEPSPSINALVAHYALGRACDLAVAIGPFLEKDQRFAVCEALATLDARDPSGLRRMWERLRRMNGAFVERELANGKVGFQLQKQLVQTSMAVNSARQMFENIVEGKDFPLNQADRRKLFLKELERASAGFEHAKLSKLHARAVELGGALSAQWDEPEAARLFKEAQSEIDADDTGLLMDVLMYPRQLRRSANETMGLLENARLVCKCLPK